MVDTEVETILREIRERVRAEQQQAASVSPNMNEEDANEALASGVSTSKAAEALARIEGYLTTTGRAWDRLPPVVSHRSGTLARLELWIKRRLKVATRWYAWEQINFNAAVHHALHDMVEVLSAFEQRLQRIQSDTEALRDQLKSHHALIESQHVVVELHRAQIESQRAESESLAAIQQAQHRDLSARVAELIQELSNRDERLLDEQRVCLKQLSLEISEATTLFDRARRQIEARLDSLEREK